MSTVDVEQMPFACHALSTGLDERRRVAEWIRWGALIHPDAGVREAYRVVAVQIERGYHLLRRSEFLDERPQTNAELWR